MRDIQTILELWGGWAASDHSQIDWQPIAAGFKGLLPYTNKSRLQCTDDEGLVIDKSIQKLKKQSIEGFHIVILHYIFGFSLRKVAIIMKCSEGSVRKKLQRVFGFLEASLEALLG